VFATYFRRARVYNVSELFEMRYDKYVASLYSVIAGIICILFIGIILLAIAKIISGITSFSQHQCVWIIAVIVGAYVFSGGLMSTLLNDIMQGLMCLFILSFVMLPFLWNKAGGWVALKQYSTANPQIWNLMGSDNITIWTILALNLSGMVGGVAAPWIYNWMQVSKNEKVATQCAWGNMWKRVITVLFAIYGILFALYHPGMSDPEQAWGIAIREILPFGVRGLLIASFFAAAMSTVGTFSTTSAAMVTDYLYRRMFSPNRSMKHYLTIGRFWVLVTILLSAISTHYIGTVEQYVQLSLTLLSFLGIPLYFGVLWKRSNRAGMWMSLIGGVVTYLAVILVVMFRRDISFVAAIKPAFVSAVFLSTAASLFGMVVGCLLGRPDDPLKIKRFHVIMNTAVGKEQRLVDAGISLPAMINAGLIPNQPEKIRADVVERLYQEDSKHKIFGLESTIELRNEPGLEWYFPGLFLMIAACFTLIFVTWLIPKILFVW
jgi:Na+/proline symporter